MCRFRAVLEDSADSSQERGLLLGRGHANTLELGVDAEVREETSRVFVEVQEGSGSAVEGASALLPKLGQAPKSREQGFKLLERLWPGVLHPLSLPIRYAGAPVERRSRRGQT